MNCTTGNANILGLTNTLPLRNIEGKDYNVLASAAAVSLSGAEPIMS